MGLFFKILIAITIMVMAMGGWYVQRRLTSRRNRRLNGRSRRRVSEASLTEADASLDEIDLYWQGSSPRGFEAWPETDALEQEASTRDDVSVATPLTAEAPLETAPQGPPTPRRIPDTAARKLATHFLGHLINQHFMLPELSNVGPQAFQALLSRLETEPADVTTAHGAIVARLAPQATLYIDPLLTSVEDAEAAAEALTPVCEGTHLIVVLGQAPEPAEATTTAVSEISAHIRPILHRFNVPPTHLFSLQDDGSYHNHLEDTQNFVPSRIDVACVPESFVQSILDYAIVRYDKGEPEAALRTLGPLAEGLWLRATESHSFDGFLLAQTLNLLGLSNRDAGTVEEAVTCFEHAIDLMRVDGDPQALQLIHRNLAETLTRLDDDPRALASAAEHLRHAIHLDQRDVGAWLLLGQIYIQRHYLLGKRSMIERAKHAFRSGLKVAPNDDALLQALKEACALAKTSTPSQRIALNAPAAPPLYHAPRATTPPASPPRLSLVSTNAVSLNKTTMTPASPPQETRQASGAKG